MNMRGYFGGIWICLSLLCQMTLGARPDPTLVAEECVRLLQSRVHAETGYQVTEYNLPKSTLFLDIPRIDSNADGSVLLLEGRAAQGRSHRSVVLHLREGQITQAVELSKPDLRVGIRESVLSPDGTRILTYANFGLIYLWDTQSGQKVAEYMEKDFNLYSNQPLGFSSDGRYGYYLRLVKTDQGSLRTDLTVLDAETGKTLYTVLDISKHTLPLFLSQAQEMVLSQVSHDTAAVQRGDNLIAVHVDLEFRNSATGQVIRTVPQSLRLDIQSLRQSMADEEKSGSTSIQINSHTTLRLPGVSTNVTPEKISQIIQDRIALDGSGVVHDPVAKTLAVRNLNGDCWYVDLVSHRAFLSRAGKPSDLTGPHSQQWMYGNQHTDGVMTVVQPQYFEKLLHGIHLQTMDQWAQELGVDQSKVYRELLVPSLRDLLPEFLMERFFRLQLDEDDGRQYLYLAERPSYLGIFPQGTGGYWLEKSHRDEKGQLKIWVWRKTP